MDNNTGDPFGRSGRLELQGEFHQGVRQQIATAKINDGAVLRLAGILPGLKAGDSYRAAHRSAPSEVPAADGLTAPFTSQAIRAVVSHPAQACAESRPSRNTSMPRERIFIAETSSACGGATLAAGRFAFLRRVALLLSRTTGAHLSGPLSK
jgi:hypothetical protein